MRIRREEKHTELTEKDKLARSIQKVDSIGKQMKKKMKSHIVNGTSRGFNAGIEAGNKVLRAFDKDPKELGGDDEITTVGLSAAAVTTPVGFTASAVTALFVAVGDQMKKSHFKLGQEQVLWMLLYGVPLIKNCNEKQLSSIVDNLRTQEHSKKAVNMLLNIYHDFNERKEDCISYISDVNNNGHRTYAALFNTLKSLHPKTHLDDTVSSEPANLALEYLFQDFKMYKTT